MPGANFAIMSITPAAARIVPFAVFMAFVLAGSLLPESPRLTEHWDPRQLFTIRAFVVMALLVLFWRGYSELHNAALTWRQVSIAIVSGIAVFFMWINLDFPWATFGEMTVFDPKRADGGIDWTLVHFRMLGLAVVVPVMEELFWRSFMLRWIDRHDFLELPPEKVSWRAIVVSSLLFASEHQMWLAGFIAGFIYAMLYVRTGNLWVPVISHVVTNAVLGAWILETGNWRFW
jgi:CAAX prenyl protease-like protein